MAELRRSELASSVFSGSSSGQDASIGHAAWQGTSAVSPAMAGERPEAGPWEQQCSDNCSSPELAEVDPT